MILTIHSDMEMMIFTHTETGENCGRKVLNIIKKMKFCYLSENLKL